MTLRRGTNRRTDELSKERDECEIPLLRDEIDEYTVYYTKCGNNRYVLLTEELFKRMAAEKAFRLTYHRKPETSSKAYWEKMALWKRFWEI